MAQRHISFQTVDYQQLNPCRFFFWKRHNQMQSGTEVSKPLTINSLNVPFFIKQKNKPPAGFFNPTSGFQLQKIFKIRFYHELMQSQ